MMDDHVTCFIIFDQFLLPTHIVGRYKPTNLFDFEKLTCRGTKCKKKSPRFGKHIKYYLLSSLILPWAKK